MKDKKTLNNKSSSFYPKSSIYNKEAPNEITHKTTVVLVKETSREYNRIHKYTKIETDTL